MALLDLPLVHCVAGRDVTATKDIDISEAAVLAKLVLS